MERRGELPSELALHNAREHRDHGWSLVLAEWKGNGSQEEFIPGVPLEEAFPQAVLRADDIADQLREQAEAVAQAEEKRFQITQSEKQNQEAEGKISELQGMLKECQTSWGAAWLPCGITPKTPVEMEEWREAWSEFKNVLRQLKTAEETFQQKASQVKEAKMHLAAVLSESADKEFTLLFDQAKRQVQQGEQSSGRRIEVINLLQGLKNQLKPFEQSNVRLVTAAKVEMETWEAHCQMIGLPKDISPKVGLSLLQERKELLGKFDRWRETSVKLQQIKEAVRQYQRAVDDKAVVLGTGGDTTEAQETALWHALAKTRDAKARHEQLVGQTEEAKNTLGESQASHSQAVQALEELVHLAKLETVEALEPLLANLELRDEAQNKIAAFRDTLSDLARGQRVDDFLTRIGMEDIETLPQRRDTLLNQKQEKETVLQAVRETLYALKGQQQTLEAAGDAAANYRQQAESFAARLKQDASRFVRLRLAAYFLQTQIELFRKENQGPLLEKSGKVFQQITRGKFGGLGAEFNADDIPILVGLRPDQTSVSITGMSDGTRDQLYLALRLAALDRYLEEHEPMPLILDDLLITCDNDRAVAILPQLAALAQRTQIFLFTHHNHLVELCQKTIDKDTFHLHQLNTNPSEKGN